MGTNFDSSERSESSREWWWVVESSNYILKQYPGSRRYSVVSSRKLDEYRNIRCVVRYSSEAAALAAAEHGGELLDSWQVIRWPADSEEIRVRGARYQAVPEREIRAHWAAGAKSVASGLSNADATAEASRRCNLPQRWCVIPNFDTRTQDDEPYAVKLAEDLSGYEEAHVKGTYNSEEEAWRAIPKITEREHGN